MLNAGVEQDDIQTVGSSSKEFQVSNAPPSVYLPPVYSKFLINSACQNGVIIICVCMYSKFIINSACQNCAIIICVCMCVCVLSPVLPRFDLLSYSSVCGRMERRTRTRSCGSVFRVNRSHWLRPCRVRGWARGWSLLKCKTAQTRFLVC